MNRTMGFWSKWRGYLAVTGLIVLAALALGGCAEPGAIAAIEPTATVYAPPPTDIPPPPPGPTPAALDFPIAAPNHVEEVTVPDDQACVDCHTNEDVLKALAKEEEVPEVESEGEG